jgi:peptidoglycan/LPS O-acetylase OafA/YrhL
MVGLPAYLAVDFFFLLSGFVITFAYDRRLDAGLSWSEFAKIRLIRLYPMLLAGTLLGGAVMLVKMLHARGAPATEAPWLALPALLLFPSGLLVGAQAYPANNPVWSLFFELLANAFYATPLRNMSRLWATTTLTVAAAVLVGEAAAYGSLATLGFESWPTFIAGVPRVAVPFSLGIVLYRTRLYLRFPRVPIWLVAAMLATALAFQAPIKWIYESAAVLIIFPILLCLGASARASSIELRACAALGALSYPIYLLHQPIFRMVKFATSLPHLRVSDGGVWSIGVSAAICTAWLALKLYDEPTRRILTRITLDRSRAGKPAQLRPAE